MGDRGNIKLVFGEQYSPVYLYTHWDGSELPEILRDALVRGRGRWDDPSYLSRIIFSEMIQNEILEETGFGISPYICDNEHSIITVDLRSNSVIIEDVGLWPFEKFIQTTRDDFADF